MNFKRYAQVPPSPYCTFDMNNDAGSHAGKHSRCTARTDNFARAQRSLRRSSGWIVLVDILWATCWMLLLRADVRFNPSQNAVHVGWLER